MRHVGRCQWSCVFVPVDPTTACSSCRFVPPLSRAHLGKVTADPTADCLSCRFVPGEVLSASSAKLLLGDPGRFSSLTAITCPPASPSRVGDQCSDAIGGSQGKRSRRQYTMGTPTSTSVSCPWTGP